MRWDIIYLDEAVKDLHRLDHSARVQVAKGIQKVAQNPVSMEQGGYGKPLGTKKGLNLTNLLKIKFRDLGIRVVYKAEIQDTVMKIIVVSVRSDDQVYQEAARRRAKYGL